MSWWNLIILLFFIGGPAIGGILKKIDEQRKLKQIQTEREGRRIEMLRTGRVEVEPPPPPPPPPITQQQQRAKRSLEELAERRKARLAQLRQQQQQRAQQLRQRIQQRTAPPPTVAVASPTSLPTIPAPPAIPAGMIDTAAQRRRPSRHAPPQAKDRIAKMRPEPEKKSHSIDRIPDLQIDAYNVKQAAKTLHQLVPKTPADWRRAIIAKELLSPPVAFRDPTWPADPIV